MFNHTDALFIITESVFFFKKSDTLQETLKFCWYHEI